MKLSYGDVKRNFMAEDEKEVATELETGTHRITKSNCRSWEIDSSCPLLHVQTDL